LGKPIVTSKTEAMEQALEASGNGMVCSDHSQFIENIVRILVEDQLSRKLSQNAKKYVREVVSWSRVAEQHLNIYKAVMDMPNVESNIIMVE
jgi:glycosyltransferase involved in cell wall biosynthesis